MDSNVIGLTVNQAPVTVPATPRGGNQTQPSGRAFPESTSGVDETAFVSTNADTKAVKAETKAEAVDVADVVALVEEKLDVLNSQLQERQRDLSFDIDKDSERPVLRVVHAQTGEVIRQIPSELALKIANNIDQGLSELVDTLA